MGNRRIARPIPVEVRQPPPTALESIAALMAPLLHPLMTTGIVIIFVIFTLLQREDLRNRLIKLAGSHDLQKTTAGARRCRAAAQPAVSSLSWR